MPWHARKWLSGRAAFHEPVEAKFNDILMTKCRQLRTIKAMSVGCLNHLTGPQKYPQKSGQLAFLFFFESVRAILRQAGLPFRRREASLGTHAQLFQFEDWGNRFDLLIG
jgi:hypothetical protein